MYGLVMQFPIRLYVFENFLNKAMHRLWRQKQTQGTWFFPLGEPLSARGRALRFERDGLCVPGPDPQGFLCSGVP